jgi:hypothetical protein
MLGIYRQKMSREEEMVFSGATGHQEEAGAIYI